MHVLTRGNQATCRSIDQKKNIGNLAGKHEHFSRYLIDTIHSCIVRNLHSFNNINDFMKSLNSNFQLYLRLCGLFTLAAKSKKEHQCSKCCIA